MVNESKALSDRNSMQTFTAISLWIHHHLSYHHRVRIRSTHIVSTMEDMFWVLLLLRQYCVDWPGSHSTCMTSRMHSIYIRHYTTKGVKHFSDHIGVVHSYRIDDRNAILMHCHADIVHSENNVLYREEPSSQLSILCAAEEWEFRNKS